MLTIFFARHERLARRVLGGFIVWHLAYVALTNLWGLFPALPPEVIRYELGDDLEHESLQGRGGLATVMDRYGELTGLWQGWALFAPNVPTTSSFLAVEFQWSADRDRCTLASATQGVPQTSVKLLSKFEPADLTSFWSPAWHDVRLYNYEWRLAALASVFDRPTGQAPTTEGLAAQRELFVQLFRRERKQFLAYLRMRLCDHLTEHPGAALPDTVVLLGRTFAPAPSDQRPWQWQPCVETPLVRWRVFSGAATDADTLDYFDPLEGRFLPVSALDAPQVASR